MVVALLPVLIHISGELFPTSKPIFFSSSTNIEDVLEHDIHHAADNLGLCFLFVPLSPASVDP